ncbi:MAG TPA: hypothetical protein VGH04_12530 [Gemmatimonadaceae bacterium]
MSRRRVVASITCVAVASSACVASSGASSSSWFNQDPATASAPSSGIESSPAITRAGGSASQDGGPRVSIYTEVENASGTNLVRASFHLDDDAYVLVGHIDGDGVLRITFPDTPVDNGFAHGHASYQTAQFLGGFAGQYRARFTTGMTRLNSSALNDSYDGGLDWVFVIASWQPMHFEKFSTGGFWDSFEINDADYMKDPRPAVYELAALLAGTNSSSYTVRFAKLLDTRPLSSRAQSLFAADNFGAQMCGGFGFAFSSGFPATPFGSSSFNPISMYGYGQPFWWRGSQYFYDSKFDCYYQAGTYLPFGYRPYGNGYGWGYIAQTPPTANPGIGRLIGVGQIRRPPLTPQPVPMRVAPGGATDVGGASGSKMALAPDNTSPQYRTRGLVAHQDPVGAEALAPRTVGPDRRARDAGNGFQTSGMVIRGGGGNDSRSQADAGNDGSSGRRAPSARGGDAPNVNSPRVDSPQNDAPRAAPQPRAESPRSDAPRMAPAPSPRVESPRVESPRMDTPRAAAPPPPRIEAPRSEAPRSAPAPAPAPAASSSTGKPPGTN